jgi:hypothetical protein
MGRFHVKSDGFHQSINNTEHLAPHCWRLDNGRMYQNLFCWVLAGENDAIPNESLLNLGLLTLSQLEAITSLNLFISKVLFKG